MPAKPRSETFDVVPGVVAAIQTHGELLHWHPHALLGHAEGVFLFPLRPNRRCAEGANEGRLCRWSVTLPSMALWLLRIPRTGCRWKLVEPAFDFGQRCLAFHGCDSVGLLLQCGIAFLQHRPGLFEVILPNQNRAQQTLGVERRPPAGFLFLSECQTLSRQSLRLIQLVSLESQFAERSHEF